MLTTLTELARSAPFPLFAIHPTRWDGPVFIGSSAWSERDGRKRLRSVQMVYLDGIDGGTIGAAVSSIDPAPAVASGGWTIDPLRDHLSDLVSRFEPDYLVTRARRRRYDPFPQRDFVQRSLTATLAGRTVAAVLLTHRELPLQLLHTAVATGRAVTDVGVAAWRLDATDLAPDVARVDAAFAKEFDELTGPQEL